MHAFFNAWVFLTRLPCPSWVEHSAEWQSRAACHASMIGVVIGGLCAALVWITAWVLPASVVVALSMAASIWLTGAFHEDGFGDMCDGFGGGWTAEQITTIMKDSRIGAYGAIGLIMILLIKFTALSEIARMLESASGQYWSLLLGVVLIAGHSLSRFAAVSFIYTHQYGGDDKASKSGFITTPMTHSGFIWAAIAGLAPLAALALWQPLLLSALLIVWLARWYIGRLFMRGIGGFSGDCLGATQQFSEVAFYLATCAIIFSF